MQLKGWEGVRGMIVARKLFLPSFIIALLFQNNSFRAEWRVTVPIEPLNLYLAATLMRSQRARPSKDDLMWSRVVNYLSARKFWRNVFIKSWNENNWRTMKVAESESGVKYRPLLLIDAAQSPHAFFPSSTSRDIDGKAKPCNLNLRPQDRDPIKSHNMSSSIIR